MTISREHFIKIGEIGRFTITEFSATTIALENERAAFALEDVDVSRITPNYTTYLFGTTFAN